MTQTSEDSPRHSKRWPAFFRMSATFEIIGPPLPPESLVSESVAAMAALNEWPPVRQGFFQAEQLECAS